MIFKVTEEIDAHVKAIENAIYNYQCYQGRRSARECEQDVGLMLEIIHASVAKIKALNFTLNEEANSRGAEELMPVLQRLTARKDGRDGDLNRCK